MIGVAPPTFTLAAMTAPPGFFFFINKCQGFDIKTPQEFLFFQNSRA
jgi:hypothetical protein